jgi:hypothetical protein
LPSQALDWGKDILVQDITGLLTDERVLNDSLLELLLTSLIFGREVVEKKEKGELLLDAMLGQE